jgi:hypothetical protein
MNRFRRTAMISLLVGLAAACDSPTGTNPQLISVADLTIEAVGDSHQLVATQRDSSRLPSWESLDPTVAAVTRAGMITGMGAGTTRVRARLGSEMVEGNVTVLPPVSIEIVAAAKDPPVNGSERVRLTIRNTGGRGFYRMHVYRTAATPDAQPTIIQQDLTDLPTTVFSHEIFHHRDVAAPADWVVVYSREPHSMEWRRTACARLDGEAGCPM